MATYYVDYAGGNNANAGTATGTAWKTYQKALDTAAAGDTVYFKAQTETLTVTVDCDTNSGSGASGFIKFIGVNSSWVNDGTRMVIDGNSAAGNCLYVTGTRSYIWHENFEYKNATSHGVSFNSYGNNAAFVFVNCTSHNNGGSGFYSIHGGCLHAYVYKCAAYSNSSHGFALDHAVYVACRASANTLDGFYVELTDRNNGSFNLCESYSNSRDGFAMTGYSYLFGSLLQCVSDNNTSDGVQSDMFLFIVGFRSTNNGGYGAKSTVNRIVYANTYMPGAGQDRVNTTGKISGSSDVINDNGTDTNNISGTDANAGYNNAGSVDYTLVDSATMRRVSLTIP
jgi:hypothetical protein